MKRKSKTCLIDSQKQELGALYLEGASLASLTERFNVSEGYCYSILRAAGQVSHARSRRSPYTLNESFFDSVETNFVAAYWAGFIAADGSIKAAGASGILRMGLSALDAPHLERFLKDVESNRPIYRTTRPYPTRTTECATVEIGSKSFVAALAKLGIVPAKTFCFDWPCLPNEAMRHFLRGYFDGDGSWLVKTTRNPRGELRFDLVGTKPFLMGCRAFLERHCEVNRVQLRRCVGANSQTMALCYSGNRQVPRIARFLYDSAPVYLNRKFLKAQPFL